MSDTVTVVIADIVNQMFARPTTTEARRDTIPVGKESSSTTYDPMDDYPSSLCRSLASKDALHPLRNSTKLRLPHKLQPIEVHSNRLAFRNHGLLHT